MATQKEFLSGGITATIREREVVSRCMSAALRVLLSVESLPSGASIGGGTSQLPSRVQFELEVDRAVIGEEEKNNLYDREIPATQVKADRFPFPCEGKSASLSVTRIACLGP